jgi:hypothetical protein
MKQKTRLKTMMMICQIRDSHHELLKDKTPEERIAFYCEHARRMNARVQSLPHEQHAENSRS